MIKVKEFFSCGKGIQKDINEWIIRNNIIKIIDIKYSTININSNIRISALVIYEDNKNTENNIKELNYHAQNFNNSYVGEVVENHEQNTYDCNSIDNALKAFRDYMSKNYRCIYTILSIEYIDTHYEFKIIFDNINVYNFRCKYDSDFNMYVIYKVN